MIDVIRLMPHFIDRPVVHGRVIYSVPNETTQGENFAERWNSEPQRAKAFFDWHARALRDLELLASLEGQDVISKSLSSSLGDGLVRKVMNARTDTISSARAGETIRRADGWPVAVQQRRRRGSAAQYSFRRSAAMKGTALTPAQHTCSCATTRFVSAMAR